MYILIAQITGIAAMLFNIFSYQMKSQKNIIRMQLFGSLLFAVNMYMLGAVMGFILNSIGVIRAIVYSNKSRFRADNKIWTYIFLIAYVCSYGLTFTVFQKEASVRNLIVELLPLIAMYATTLSFSMKKSSDVRKFAFISSPLWLAYNCVNLAIGGALCEIFSLISNTAAVIRLDRKSTGGKGNENTNP